MSASDTWLIVSAVAQSISAGAQSLILIGIPVTIFLYWKDQRSISKIEKDKWDRFYAYLDDFYFRIQSLTIDRPHLVDQSSAKAANFLAEYDSFAFIMWNFLESIYDYGQKDDDIMKTWHPILIIEAKRHGAWFADTRNRRAFKMSFCNYIDENRYAIN